MGKIICYTLIGLGIAGAAILSSLLNAKMTPTLKEYEARKAEARAAAAKAYMDYCKKSNNYFSRIELETILENI